MSAVTAYQQGSFHIGHNGPTECSALLLMISPPMSRLTPGFLRLFIQFPQVANSPPLSKKTFR